MERFGERRDPLAERVSDEELGELLERLGEAELGGGDQATVGAVVEATGADAATILGLLHEIRQEALDRRQIALEAVERRVRRLEARSAAETHEPESLPSAGARVAFTVGLLAFGVMIVAILKGAGQGAASAVPTYSTEISAGTLTLGSDRVLRVVLPDGSTRAPTPEEAMEGSVLNAAAAESSAPVAP